MSISVPEIPAAECDPVLLQLMDLYTKKDALNMVAKLDQIAVESGSRNSRQEALGTLDCISIIFSFFASIMGAGVTTSDNELSLQQSCAFVMDPVDVADVELQRQLVEKSLWVLVRLCRREMAKSTASIANIELIENYPQSFELINNVASKLVCYSQIAYPVTYLFMILASDSAERQYKLILAGAPVLVVSIINQNITDDLVIEMSCRALRNLAAGEADLVAKMVEDKVCESLVRVLHTQLGTVPEKIGTADGNTISLNPENILVELDNTSGIENETLTSAVHTNIVGSQSVVDESHDQQFVTVDKIVNESVCEAALWAIVNLACDENVSTIFGTIGGVEALVEVAQKCKNSSTVSLAAVSALRNISSVGTLNYTLLAKTEVCQVLLDIFKEHSTDLDVVETSLWTITNLACDSILSNRLGSLHAAEIIVDIYFRYVCVSSFPPSSSFLLPTSILNPHYPRPLTPSLPLPPIFLPLKPFHPITLSLPHTQSLPQTPSLTPLQHCPQPPPRRPTCWSD